MPIRPEEIDPSKLPVGLRGYQKSATEELLKRVAWDYRQALRGQETHGHGEQELRDRVAELERQLDEERARTAEAAADQSSRFERELRERTGHLNAEVMRLEAELREHQNREELTRTLLQTTQRSVREMRESARAECEAILRAAHRHAVEIERDAKKSVRRSASEVDRLRRLEGDLRDRLRSTLEAIVGEDGALAEEKAPPEPAPAPEHWPTSAVD